MASSRPVPKAVLRWIRAYAGEEFSVQLYRQRHGSNGFSNEATMNISDVQLRMVKDLAHLGVGNQQNWDTLRPKRSGVGLRSSQLPECPVVLSSPLDCLGLHFLPAS